MTAKVQEIKIAMEKKKEAELTKRG